MPFSPLAVYESTKRCPPDTTSSHPTLWTRVELSGQAGQTAGPDGSRQRLRGPVGAGASPRPSRVAPAGTGIVAPCLGHRQRSTFFRTPVDRRSFTSLLPKRSPVTSNGSRFDTPDVVVTTTSRPLPASPISPTRFAGCSRRRTGRTTKWLSSVTAWAGCWRSRSRVGSRLPGAPSPPYFFPPVAPPAESATNTFPSPIVACSTR